MFEKIDKFLQDKTSSLSKLIVIYGPTACGKTALSLDIAEKLETEIISADSRQIYRCLDIGTGKIQKHEMRGIPHHMIDIIDPDEDYSVESYKSSVLSIIEAIHKKGKIPVLCGGTGLYIDAIVFKLQGPKAEPDWQYREELETFRQEYGNEALWKKLSEVDPEYAQEIHPNNYRYIMRGLEVIKETGVSKRESKQEKELRFDTLFITPYDGDRAGLYKKIDTRVHAMFEDGLIKETRHAIEKGYKGTDPGLTGIGYREAIDYLEGMISGEKCEQLTAQYNRNYAKRQLTWFRKYGPYH